MERVGKKMSRTNKPRKEPLAKGWWLKVGKDPSAGGPILQQLIGSQAYRGRKKILDRKFGELRPTARSGRRDRRPIAMGI